MQRRLMRVHWIAIIAAGALCADAFLISPSPTPYFPSHAKHCAEFNTLCLGKHRGLRTSAINLGLSMEVKPQLVAVVGATGGVGRLTVAACLQLGLKIRAIVRDQKKATALLPDSVEVVQADLARPDYGIGLKAAFQGVSAVVLATGTSAFPSEKWGKDNVNSPKVVDEEGIKNAVKAIEAVNTEARSSGTEGVQRVTLLSSIGVQRRNKFPFLVLNMFGVLDAKAAGEEALRQAAKKAGFEFAIVRPGRLVGGPYTNPDFAKLLQLDEGDMQNVELRNGDPDGFAGDASRRQTSLAIAQTLIQVDWDRAFDRLSRPTEVLRLEFTSLDEVKFKRWLVNWGGGLVTSGSLFPPLPLPFRVDYLPEDQIGLVLTFLSVTVVGQVTPLGALDIRLQRDGRAGPALVVTRQPLEQTSPFPGEGQILDKLQDDLYRVTNNARAAGGAQSVWGANNIDT